MNIIEATKQLTLGKKIRRKNWQTTYLKGKISPQLYYPDYENYATGYRGEHWTNWSCSTTEILADDWEVVGE